MHNYQNPVLLQGMGGMGKSELMSSWVHQVSNQTIIRSNYQNIIYINCSNDIETGFLTNSNVLGQLGISDQIEDKNTDKLSVITAALNQLEHLLLILDDLPWHEPATTKCNAQLAYLKTLSCQIIATSRSQDYQQFQSINISSLSENECINLFSKHSKIAVKENDSIIKEIINLAGRHTLTIELLAKTAYRQQYTPAELFKRLQTSNFNINTKVRYDKDLNSAYEDIDTALGKLFAIAGLTLEQKHILYHLSLMDSQAFSLDLLIKWLGIDIINNKSVLMDLVISGWLQESAVQKTTNNEDNFHTKYYYVHQVVTHALITKFFSEYHGETRSNFFRPMITHIRRHYEQLDSYQSNKQHFLEQTPQEQRLDQACLPALAAYLRHSVCCNDNSTLLEIYIYNLNCFIIFCQQQALYTLGLNTLNPCIATIGSCLGEQNPNYATSISNLASLHQNTGNYTGALHLYKQATNINRNQLDKHHPNYATSLNNLANLYEIMGEYAQALPLFKKALGIRKINLEEHPLDYANSLNCLAGLYESMKNDELALPLYIETYSIRKEHLGEQHPDCANSLNNIAVVYQNMGKYEQALPLYKAALKIVKKQLGEQHPFYAKSLNNLACSYKHTGCYEQALPLYQQSLAIIKKQFGTYSPDYAVNTSNLADLYISMGNFNQALLLFGQAFNIAKQTLGSAHPITQNIKEGYEIGKNCFIADKLSKSWFNNQIK